MMTGVVLSCVIGIITECNFKPPRLHDKENKVVRWNDQLYQMVPVEKKIEYVKPEAK